MPRVLSGMQPSGNPHLGNYLGAMKKHIELQKNYECFYFIANLHALTTVRDPEKLLSITRHLALDYLALGLNPQKTIFFRQSDIPEVTELTWILDCITHIGLLERAHAWKDALAKGKKETSVGLFNYPVLMAADILIYQANLVPVGKDQKQHVEMARDIALTFNHLFGPTFTLPEPMIDQKVATIKGTDGVHKMSKSYGNVIEIFAPEETLKTQIMGMFTDPSKIKKGDPGRPEICNVFNFHKIYSAGEVKEIKKSCESGALGCVFCKKKLARKILDEFAPYRAKRVELEKKLDYVEDVLQEGARKARKIAKQTLTQVRKKVGLDS